MVLPCSKYKILIHKQLEGRATELEIRQLRQHLDTCSNCSRYQEETTALMEALRLTPVPAPPGLQTCVAQRIQNQQRETSSRKPFLTTGLLLGSSCIAAGCLVLLFFFLGVDFLSLPANIYEHLSLFISNFSVSFESLLSGLSNVWARFSSFF